MDYKQKLLMVLTSKYDKRILRYGDSTIHRKIMVKPKELYRKYGQTNSDLDIERLINDAATYLQDQGFVTIKHIIYSDAIDKILLNDDKITAIHTYLHDTYGITPRDRLADQANGLIRHYRSSGVLTKYYCDRLSDQITHTIKDIDIDHEQYMLKLLDFIQSNDRDLYVREVSMEVFGSSKIFESQPFYDQVCTIIRDALSQPKGDDALNDDILNRFHISTLDQEILIKGDIDIIIDGQTISLSHFSNGIAIVSKDIDHLDRIKINTDHFMTIENKTAFYRFDQNDYCALYLGGYANRYQVALIKKIHHDNPDIDYVHFGDIDIGGFYIHHHLCDSTNIPFGLYHMGIKDLHDPTNASCLMPLTDNDRSRAIKLLDDQRYTSIIKTMLDENIKLEQEIIALHLSDH